MRPYYDHAGITIWHGDVLDLLPRLSDAGAAVVYTDPPFTAAGGSTNGRGNDADTQFFDHWFLAVCNVLVRHTLDAGCWLLHCDWRTIGSIQRCVARIGQGSSESFRAGNFRVSQALYWHRGALGLGSPFRNAVEMIAFAPGPEWSSDMPKNVPTLIEERWPYGTKEHHGAEKPVPLIERLLGWVEPTRTGLVFDPFMGSGSTLVAARAQGRRAIGIEREERYCEVAAKRLSQSLLFPIATPEPSP